MTTEEKLKVDNVHPPPERPDINQYTEEERKSVDMLSERVVVIDAKELPKEQKKKQDEQVMPAKDERGPTQ